MPFLPPNQQRQSIEGRGVTNGEKSLQLPPPGKTGKGASNSFTKNIL